MAGNAAELQLLVLRRLQETADILTLELVSPTGDKLPSFTAGAHLDVHVPDGPVRQYSLCGDAEDRNRYRLGILNDPVSRGGSSGVHERVREGSTLRVSAPRNHFPLDEGAKHSILLAGGIGVTPILCMARRLSAIDQSFEMHYCTRSKGHTAFRAEIAASPFAHRVQHHFDDGDEDQLLDIPGLLASPAEGTHVYVCGPTGFMDAVLNTAREAGWPEEQLHYEFFSADVGVKEDDGSFELKLARAGRTITVGAEQTVVEALAEAGIDLPVSCEQGVCGTCLTKVLEGEPEHRDMYLTPDEAAANDQFLPCCSRSKSPVLVIDI